MRFWAHDEIDICRLQHEADAAVHQLLALALQPLAVVAHQPRRGLPVPVRILAGPVSVSPSTSTIVNELISLTSLAANGMLIGR